MARALATAGAIAGLSVIASLGLAAEVAKAGNPGPAANPPAPADTAAAQGAPPAVPADRSAAYQQFRDHFNARRFAEALPAAEQVVTLTEQQFGTERAELIKPLLNVGTTQMRLNNLYGAETAYRRALRIAEAREGGFSRGVIEPLHGLGLAYHAGGQYHNAAETLRRAVDVSRKLDGLFNIQQLPLVESLVESYVALEQTADVDREQQYAMRLSENAYGKDDPRMLPVLARNAQWCESTRRYRMARQSHARALEILGRTAGKRDPSVVAPLRGIAHTYVQEFLYGTADAEETRQFSSASSVSGTIGGMPQPTDYRPSRLDADGEQALKLALSVLAEHPELTGIRGETLLDLGDWYALAGKPADASRTYRDAWATFTGPNGPGTAAMDQPLQLYYRPPSSASRRTDKDEDEMEEHYVEVAFTVNPDGRVIDTKTVASDGTDTQEKSVQIALRRARYRPRFVDGKAVVTTGVRYRQTLYTVSPTKDPSA